MAVHFLDIDALSVRYRDDGSGSVVLFLHGWGASFEAYAPLLSELAKHHRVIAPDFPGAGGSQEPPLPWRCEDYVRFVLRFAAALGLTSVHLIGHSHGGRVILKLLGDGFDAGSSSVVLPDGAQNARDASAPPIASPARASAGAAPPLSIQKAALLAPAGIRHKRKPSYYLRVYAYKAMKRLLSPLPGFREKLTKKAGSADYRNASPVMRGTLSLLVGEDLTPLLPSIQRPTLLIWGDADTETPLSDAKLMQARIPDVGLVVLRGGSHWACMEQWPYVARVLASFL